MLTKEASGWFEAANGMLRLAAADGGGSDDEGAIRDGFGNGFELFGASEQWLSANRGTRFAGGQFVGIHYAQMEEAKVAHGASSGADVERIARLDKDDVQVLELGEGRQESEFTAEEKR